MFFRIFNFYFVYYILYFVFCILCVCNFAFWDFTCEPDSCAHVGAFISKPARKFSAKLCLSTFSSYHTVFFKQTCVIQHFKLYVWNKHTFCTLYFSVNSFFIHYLSLSTRIPFTLSLFMLVEIMFPFFYSRFVFFQPILRVFPFCT